MRLDTILDYTYDVNYSVQKGECLKLDMNKSLSYCMEYEDHIGASNTIPFEMESVDIDGEGRIYHTSTSGFKYDCYLKDHLGSTRMVVNDENFVTEAFAYQPYGTIIPLEDIAATPQTPTRQQFTGKEFDTEGEDSENGVVGIQAYHFGARVYDPDIGVWLAVDAAGQYLNPYGYSTNPVIMVDPDGNYFIGAIIGGAIGFAAGGLIGGAISGEDWSWSGALQGMMMGASLGSGIENSILASRFGPGNFNLPKTAYGRRFMLDMYKPILARGANFLPEENTLVEVKDPKFSNNVQRMNKRVLKNYLKANSESIGSHEVMQYAEMKDGKYSWIHEIGETIGGTEVTSVLRPDVSRFYDITHTHPGGGIPTGYPQSSNGFIATTAPSDMNLAKTAIRNKFTGTFHVYDIPNNLYYGFYPSSSNSLMLNYWQILGP